MITHELFGQHLRLGNFLFKYAWSIAMQEKYFILSSFPDYYLWKYLNLRPLKEHEADKKDAKMLRPSHWHWSKEEQDRVEHFINHHQTQVSLDFFFQSENWFKGYEQQVFNYLKPKEVVSLSIFGEYLDILLKCPIGIGIRLGDFEGHNDFYQIPHEWYIDALNTHFPNWEKENNILVFSDDIEKAKVIFKDYPFYYAEANHTHTHAENFKWYHGDASKQFFLGTLMAHFIIGNSTFSWWQAWLSEHHFKGKIVHSGEVFSNYGNMKDFDTSQYYPDRWTKH